MNIVIPEVENFIEKEFRPLNPALKQFGTEDGRDYLRILPETEMILRTLLAVFRPEKILEAGTANGYSAAVMATVLPEAEIVTIERNEERCRKAESRFSMLGLSKRITVINGDVTEQIRKLAECREQRETFDMAFLDAGKSHYPEYLSSCMPLLSKRALIAADDVLMRGTVADRKFDPRDKHRTSIRAMKEFISQIMNMEGAQSCIIPAGDGLSVTLMEKK